MSKWTLAFVVAIGLWVWFLATLKGAEPAHTKIYLELSASQGYEPLEVRLKVWVSKEYENEMLCAVAVGTDNDYVRSSCQPHEGIKASLVVEDFWFTLATGEYKIQASVWQKGKNDPARSLWIPVKVLSRGGI